ncbi:MAG: hypothetical protein ACRC1T_05630 [Clostridium chrysemydis]|uniref:hypothetical protein n=1 Tax=Clostridium chrysemydis TaxID=2665504 RepID=UPI003F3BB436
MIKIGSYIKTNKEYEEKLYEPLYFEKILKGKVLEIDKDNVVTYELIESSCDFSKRFNFHMNRYKKGRTDKIGLCWLEEY